MPDLATLLQLAGALLATGVIAGLLAGLLGVGGGIVTVPVLYQMFVFLDIPEELRMHLAVGTSLMAVVATSFVSARAHRRRGAMDIGLLKRWWVWILIGTLAGTALAGFVRGAVLTAIFATVASVVAIFMAATRPGFRLREEVPRGLGKVVSAGLIGGISAMMGIGGGTLAVPYLSAFGYPVHRAVGTSSAFGFIISVPATIGFVLAGWGKEALPQTSFGFVNLLGVALIAPVSTWMAPYGARLAHRLSPVWLRRAFAVFLALTAARMYYGLLT